MARVARSHGGDCGGDPPGGDDYWRPPSGCQGSGSKGVRGRTTNKGLKATIGKNKSKLSIEFEADKNNTYIAVGPNGDSFNTLLGTIVSKIPCHFPSWKQIPPEYRTTVIPELEDYFDIRPHLEGPKSVEVDSGINQYCARRYRDQKHKFYKTWVTRRGGKVDELRDAPPPDVTEEDWHEFLNHVTSQSFTSRSAKNKDCRAKQTITVRQGRKALAQSRYERRVPVTLEPPSPIDEYARLRSKNGRFTETQAADNHARMTTLRDAQVGVPNPMTEEDIVQTVLGTRRGWQHGVGQKLPQSSRFTASSSSSQTSRRTYTQDEVDQMMSQVKSSMMDTMKSYTAPLFEALNSQGLLPANYFQGNEEDGEHENEDEDEDENGSEDGTGSEDDDGNEYD